MDLVDWSVYLDVVVINREVVVTDFACDCLERTICRQMEVLTSQRSMVHYTLIYGFFFMNHHNNIEGCFPFSSLQETLGKYL